MLGTTGTGTTQPPSSASANKTIQMEGNSEKTSKDEFEVVKEYLLKCPHVSSVRDSPAIKAAIEGIEKEQRRQIRDAKLRSKFGAGVQAKSSMSSDSYYLAEGDEIVVVERHDIDGAVTSGNPASGTSRNTLHDDNNNIDDDDDMEWQDVPQQQKEEIIAADDGMESSGIAIGDSFIMEQGEEPDGSDSCCYLGKTLAKACIDAIAEQQMRSPLVVSTPLAAIAVALHAALRSEVLGFACTGVPEDNTKTKGGGFAPPVRELSRTEFLPRWWDDDGKGNKQQQQQQQQENLRSPLPLRYRKMDTGAVVLRVEGLSPGGDGDSATEWARTECQVTFVPSNGKGDDSTHAGLKFPLSEHTNLDSWNAAMLKAGSDSKIAPSLHYKNLSGLLSKFCRAFDLGSVNSHVATDDCEPIGTDTGMVRTTTINSSSHTTMEPPTVLAERNSVGTKSKNCTTESWDEGVTVPSTLDEAFPAPAAAARRNRDPTPRVDYPPHGGDFPDDLLPASSGLRDPRFGRIGGRMSGSGNLMGPNHPIFSGGGGHGGGLGGPGGGLAFGGPGTMQPRYDPIVPPGIGGGHDIPQPGSVPGRRPNHKNNRRGRVPGEPNPDHLPPPNSLGDDMFM